jgi:hypothetical protein
MLQLALASSDFTKPLLVRKSLLFRRRELG